MATLRLGERDVVSWVERIVGYLSGCVQSGWVTYLEVCESLQIPRGAEAWQRVLDKVLNDPRISSKRVGGAEGWRVALVKEGEERVFRPKRAPNLSDGDLLAVVRAAGAAGVTAKEVAAALNRTSVLGRLNGLGRPRGDEPARLNIDRSGRPNRYYIAR